jgi:alkylation response protein AidB-like acyl-CoA dehydrogenase
MLDRPRAVFGEDHRIFRQSVRRFVDAELVPHQLAWDEAGIVPREVWRAAGAAGLLCCDVAAEWGGPGGNFGHNAVVVEELARAGLSGPGFVVHSDMVATYLARFGNDGQRRRWLPGMCDGTSIGAIAMTEPDAGSDLQGMRTRALRDGDHYVLSGAKTFISNGQNCHLAIVAAKTDPQARARGISLLVVEADRPGFRRGRNLRKIGSRGQDTSELFFDDVRVPLENRLGEEGEGFAMLMTNLARERLVQAIRAATAVEAAIDWTVSQVRNRRMFGKRLADFQNTRFVLAEVAAKAAAARCLVDRAIALQFDGSLDPVEAAMAKLFCTDLQCEALDRCLQMFGGSGYMQETPIARAWTDARVTRIAGGAAEVMKEIIGRRLFERVGD